MAVAEIQKMGLLVQAGLAEAAMVVLAQILELLELQILVAVEEVVAILRVAAAQAAQVLLFLDYIRKVNDE